MKLAYILFNAGFTALLALGQWHNQVNIIWLFTAIYRQFNIFDNCLHSL